MATKSKTKYVRYNAYYKGYACSGSPVRVPIVQVLACVSSRTGMSLPNYKARIRSGLPATTSMTAQKQDIVFKQGFVQVQITKKSCPNVGKTMESTQCGLNLALAPSPSGGSVEAKAQSAAAIGIRKRIYSENTGFSGLTVLGELRETIGMLKNPVKGMREHLDLFGGKAIKLRNARAKRKRRLSKAKYERALADAWLEFSFGVKPLMQDISDIAQSALEQIAENRVKRISYTGHAEESVSSPYQNGVSGLPVEAYYSKDDKTSAHVRYTVGYKVEIEAQASMLQNIVNHGGFNLSEIIPTAWELLPWSFFIDYFSNIGDCLAADMTSTDRVIWVNKTIRTYRSVHVHSGRFKISPGAESDDILIAKDSSEYLATTSTVVRTSGPLDFPALQFAVPGSRNQFLNLAALATLIFK